LIVVASLRIALMGAVTVVMECHQRSVFIEQTRFLLRALFIGTGLAALSEGDLLSYNYLTLEQADVQNGVKALQ